MTKKVEPVLIPVDPVHGEHSKPRVNWTIQKVSPVTWEYWDDNRLRAILQKRTGDSPWVVHRVSSKGQSGGSDSFKTKRDAHKFITCGRIFN